MPTAPRFWRENPSRYNLVGLKCNNCGRTYFPSRAICPVCHRKSVGKMEEVKLKGTGKVYTVTTVEDCLDDQAMLKPYVLAIVEMDEGAKITGQVIDCECCDVQIGTPVRAVLRKLSEEGSAGVIHYGYKFVPIREPACDKKP